MIEDFIQVSIFFGSTALHIPTSKEHLLFQVMVSLSVTPDVHVTDQPELCNSLCRSMFPHLLPRNTGCNCCYVLKQWASAVLNSTFWFDQGVFQFGWDKCTTRTYTHRQEILRAAIFLRLIPYRQVADQNSVSARGVFYLSLNHRKCN